MNYHWLSSLVDLLSRTSLTRLVALKAKQPMFRVNWLVLLTASRERKLRRLPLKDRLERSMQLFPNWKVKLKLKKASLPPRNKTALTRMTKLGKEKRSVGDGRQKTEEDIQAAEDKCNHLS